jgi:hypothetical protein
MVRVTREGFAALVAGRSQRLSAELSDALAAVREPRAELVLERGDAQARCWVGADAACLLAPEGDDRYRVFSLGFDELPPALLRAVGARRAAPPGGPEIVVSPGELAGALARAARRRPAGGRLGPLLDGFAAHWRIGDGERAVEVIDTAAGCWAVAPADGAVELRPVGGDWIADATAELVGAARA